MTHSFRLIGQVIVILLALGGTAIANDPRELTWDDLIPGGAAALMPPQPPPGHGAGDESWDDEWDDDAFEEAFSTPAYPVDVVEELDGEFVKIPGFVVPLEVSRDGKVSEFLLVPYFGACIHYPPPPPNQLVYITAGDPIDLDSTWEPIWAIGELKTEFRESGLGSAGYTMTTQVIEKYEY